MQIRFLAFVFLCAAASADTLVGTVVSIDKNQLRVKSSAGEVQLQADEKTSVIKAKVSHDLSPLAVGDVVKVNFHGESPEPLVAVNIVAEVAVSGVIKESAPLRITIVPDSKTGGVSRTVFLSPDTKYGTRKADLTVGRKVQVTGWDVGDGAVDAEKIAIYNTDLPAQPRK